MHTPPRPPPCPQEDSHDPVEEESVAAQNVRLSRRAAPPVERLRRQFEEASDDLGITLRASKGAHALSVDRVRKFVTRLQEELFSYEDVSDNLSRWLTSHGAPTESSSVQKKKEELSSLANARIYPSKHCRREPP